MTDCCANLHALNEGRGSPAARAGTVPPVEDWGGKNSHPTPTPPLPRHNGGQVLQNTTPNLQDQPFFVFASPRLQDEPLPFLWPVKKGMELLPPPLPPAGPASNPHARAGGERFPIQTAATNCRRLEHLELVELGISPVRRACASSGSNGALPPLAFPHISLCLAQLTYAPWRCHT